MSYRITAPVADFRGTVAGVEFVDGQATTDNEAALAYFRRHGYRVEDAAGDVEADTVEDVDEDQEQEQAEAPAQSASKAEWVAYATAHPDEARRLSVEDAEQLTKAELVERFGR